jgi:hypothetical protein
VEANTFLIWAKFKKGEGAETKRCMDMVEDSFAKLLKAIAASNAASSGSDRPALYTPSFSK